MNSVTATCIYIRKVTELYYSDLVQKTNFLASCSEVCILISEVKSCRVIW